MAEDLYTQLFPSCSTRHDPPTALTHNPLNTPSHLSLDELYTHQNTDDARKRRRNQSIVLAGKIRRKRMRDYFSTLETLLPLSTSRKAARYCIIEEACKYIHTLQNKVQDLKKKKAQLSWENSSRRGGSFMENIDSELNLRATDPTRLSVGVEVYSSESVIIKISASRMPRSLSKIYEEVEAHDLDVKSGNVLRGNSLVSLYFHATVIVRSDSYNSSRKRQRKTPLQTSLQHIY